MIQAEFHGLRQKIVMTLMIAYLEINNKIKCSKNTSKGVVKRVRLNKITSKYVKTVGWKHIQNETTKIS